ncbi:MAG: hemerythrin domain-containing protein [Bdellovibrionota bacterium]
MKNTHATRLLRNDHKELTGLFRQFEAVDLRAHEMKIGVAREIFAKIEIHTRLEEEFFYPLLEDASLAEDALEDHREMRAQIAELFDSRADQVQFDAKMVELIETMEAHVYREENVLIPKAEEALGAALDALGEEMLKRKESLLKMHEFRDAHPQFAQNPHGGEQKRAA